MSRSGAKAKRQHKPSKPEPKKYMPYFDLHELVCGCAGGNTADATSLCLFGDGWLDAA